MVSWIQKQRLSSILWMVLNCFMAASVLSIVKYFVSGFHLSVLISSYHFISTILTLLVIIYCKHNIKTPVLHFHFLRSLCSVIAYFLYFYALSLTSMANVIALGYTDAILTCLFCYLFLKEPLSKTHIINMILSFFGAVMIIRPDANIFNLGALLACLSAVLWAISNVIIKIIGKTDKEIVQLFYSNFFTCLLAGIVVIYQGHISSFYNACAQYHWLILLAILTSIQAFALFKSLGLAPSGEIMPFFIVSILFVHLYGYLLFGEVQDTTEILGTLLIIIVGIAQILRIYL